MTEPIIWLNDHQNQGSRMGSKAATLARLHQQGLPVPEGFCIPADALVSPGWAEAALAAYRRLTAAGKFNVAVRSSAFAEDLANASFAGQYETILHIADEAALLAAIHTCAGSAEATRVVDYTAHHALAVDVSGVSVLVQRMINAEMAGVLFTADPVTGSHTRIVIEAVPQVAEDFVSGSVTPARVVLDRQQGTVVISEAVDKLPAALRHDAVWSPLLAMALKIEAYLAAPQDIEWAYQDGQFWILQSRPISTQAPAVDLTRLTRANIGEVLPGVVSPLTISTFLHALRAGEDENQDVKPSEMLTMVEGRAYIDTQLLWNSYSHILGLRPTAVLTKGLGCDVMGREAELAAATPPIGISGTAVKSLYVWLELLTNRLVKPRLERQVNAIIRPRLDSLKAAPLGANDAIWQTIQELLSLTHQAFTAHMQSSFIALCAYAVAHAHLERVVGTQTADRLTSTTAAQQATNLAALHQHLHQLVDQVRASATLTQIFESPPTTDLLPQLQADPAGQALLHQITQVAQALGDRGVQEFELKTPRWSEDPRLLIATLRAYVVSDAPETADVSAPDNAPESLEQYLKTVSPLRRVFIRHIFQRFVDYSHTREQTKSALMACFSEMRRCYRQLAARLCASGRLDQADDIFFLEIDELEALLTPQTDSARYTDLIEARRTAHTRYMAGGAASSLPLDPDAQVLSGTAVSAGVVTGRARVVADPAQAALQSGDILIAEYTDPGWTPLFLVSAAIVTEIGGILSHTGTLARELKKPAIFSVMGATRLIQDGQRITVDGSSGKIYLHPD